MAKKPPIHLTESFCNDINSYELASNFVDLYWFTQIIDAGSFSIAATNHNLSKSNLSRRLSQLETRLGVQLLHRNPRALTLTNTGVEVYRHTLEMVSYAQKAIDSVQQSLDVPKGKVTFVIPAILSSWLMPALLNFQNTYQHIQLSLLTADTTKDIHSKSTDLALSLFEPPANSNQIVARPLASLTFVNIVSTHFKQTNHLRQILVSKPTTPSNQEKNIGLQVNNYLSALEAALAGFGHANLPLFTCRTGLSTGELKYYDDYKDSRTLFAFTQSHRSITLATRMLLDYLILYISQSKTPGIQPISQPNGV